MSLRSRICDHCICEAFLRREIPNRGLSPTVPTEAGVRALGSGDFRSQPPPIEEVQIKWTCVNVVSRRVGPR